MRSIFPQLNNKAQRKRVRIILLVALILVLLAVAIIQLKPWFLAKRPLPEVKQAEKEFLPFYAPKKTGMLEKKIIEVHRHLSESERAQRILSELAKLDILPEDLKLIDIISDAHSIMYVNLSKELADEKLSTTGEISIIYALANSFLVNFRSIAKIHFLVEGKPVYTVNGLLYLHEPIEFNKDLLED